MNIDALRDAALSWHIPVPVQSYRGLRLIVDARQPAPEAVSVARFVVRANHRLGPVDALLLASEAIEAAKEEGLDPSLFCAVMLQESAFSPTAMSSAGAVGIAQFTVETADAYGIDPFDPHEALRGAARLLAGYVRRYRGVHRDPYATALAAYNAGPGTVTYYHGVPPYRETRDYIDDINERRLKILLMQIAPAGRPGRAPKHRRSPPGSSRSL